MLLYAGVAQMVEQLIRNQQVGGSSPPAGSMYWLGFPISKVSLYWEPFLFTYVLTQDLG